MAAPVSSSNRSSSASSNRSRSSASKSSSSASRSSSTANRSSNNSRSAQSSSANRAASNSSANRSASGSSANRAGGGSSATRAEGATRAAGSRSANGAAGSGQASKVSISGEARAAEKPASAGSEAMVSGLKSNFSATATGSAPAGAGAAGAQGQSDSASASGTGTSRSGQSAAEGAAGAQAAQAATAQLASGAPNSAAGSQSAAVAAGAAQPAQGPTQGTLSQQAGLESLANINSQDPGQAPLGPAASQPNAVTLTAPPASQLATAGQSGRALLGAGAQLDRSGRLAAFNKNLGAASAPGNIVASSQGAIDGVNQIREGDVKGGLFTTVKNLASGVGSALNLAHTGVDAAKIVAPQAARVASRVTPVGTAVSGGLAALEDSAKVVAPGNDAIGRGSSMLKLTGNAMSTMAAVGVLTAGGIGAVAASPALVTAGIVGAGLVGVGMLADSPMGRSALGSADRFINSLPKADPATHTLTGAA